MNLINQELNHLKEWKEKMSKTAVLLIFFALLDKRVKIQLGMIR